MDDWISRLARAYAACRATHPEDTALLVVDVGALVDGGEPQPGIADIVRLFQAQPLTEVALLSGGTDGRPALDALARRYDVVIDPELTVARVWDLQRDGHRVAAVIAPDRDPRPEDAPDGPLVLGTATVLASRRPLRPDARPGPVELVWHRVNQPIVRRQFLASPIKWGEIDVRCDDRGRLVVHHEDLDSADGDVTPAADVLQAFRDAGKGVNLDVKDPNALGATLDAVADHGFPDEDVWMNGRIDQLGEDGLKSVKKRFPGARLQCPLEFLGQVVATMPDMAHDIVSRIQSWGVDRFSLAWTHPDSAMIRDRLDDWGLDTNLYAITDLEQFLAAVLTVPRSLTADFTIPEWHYFGRGGGNDGEFHRDPQKAAADPPGIDIA